MARVLIPQNPRRYNDNAAGATTTIVTMRAHNPFESNRTFLSGPASQRRGRALLAGLGDEGLPYTPEDTAIPADSGSSFDWGGILKTGIDAAGKLGVPLITGLMSSGTTPAGQAAPVVLQTAPRTTAPLVAAAPASSKLPWIIGGVAALGLVAFLVLRRK